MPDSCCAYGCTNRREENGDRAFYRFPRGKKEEQQELREKSVFKHAREKLVRTACECSLFGSCFLVKHSGRITFSNTLINLAFSSC